MNGPTGSVGLVSAHDFSFGIDSPGLRLTSGQSLEPVTLRYETYGTLNQEMSNAILVLHAFSGDAHAAGFHNENDRSPGWWDMMIGPGKAFDTDSYYIICSNVLGGCMGSTGPSSVNPANGTVYGLDFPVITIRDMVNAQARLIEELGIEQLLAVAGGSMGGMQALEWSIAYPHKMKAAIVIASTGRLSAQGIAFDAVGRNAIMQDPRFKGGKYTDGEKPSQGLAIARMVGHITYLSDESMRQKFGRRLQTRDSFQFDFEDEFEVESYLAYQGEKFVDRFDANSYIYLTKAMDYYDIAEGYPNLEAVLSQAKCRYLLMSFSSDWLFPPYQSKELVYAMMKCGLDVSYAEIQSPYGHDAFLLEKDKQTPIIQAFLAASGSGQRL